MRGRTMRGPPVLFKLGIKVNFGQVIKDKSHFSEDWEVRERFGEVRERFRRGLAELNGKLGKQLTEEERKKKSSF